MRALLEDDYVAEYVAAEVRGGLYEHSVLVHVEVDGVGGQAGAQIAHHARGHVAADGAVNADDLVDDLDEKHDIPLGHHAG